MKIFSIFIVLILFVTSCDQKEVATNNNIKTICNPLNLSYRFQLDEASRREAADPTVVVFKNEYYLFASKSGGYWHSPDLVDWTFIETDEIPTEQYAPTALVIQDTMYFMASSNSIYKAIDLNAGKWELAATIPFSVVDPALFLDDDGRLYFYWGCSDKDPIYGIELDYHHNFKPIGERVELIYADTRNHGWEVPGDYNTQLSNAPWIEGAWMNKHDGKYYLQYAGPGTQFKSYSDGVYTSENPLGPYQLAENNPFAYRPEGFATGAGHGSTFQDLYGNYWHIGTVTISQKHMFERRLALFPTFFDDDGELYSRTCFGDFPMIIPNRMIKNVDELFPNWMLLSYNKPVLVSSELKDFQKENLNDEDIRTYWAAEGSSDTEWAMIDLEQQCDVHAIQVNFAEHNAQVFGRQVGLRYRYIVEVSSDAENWKTIIDKSAANSDYSHDYTALNTIENCRYIRIRNLEMPTGNFALCGLRVFGVGNGNKPEIVEKLAIERDAENRRSVKLSWSKSKDALGYHINYGVSPEKLYQNYQIYSDTSVIINSLNVNKSYFFSIQAFNENGISKSNVLLKAD
ncbi:family 43 glycosylhydrolase [Sunxiuqinia sp. A32]|uniref:family 43 glycosylhydrolase n=1 Tax=Sunxiuqinia sp. A32 TaxID=3461496 RepID=UPI004046535E